MESRFFEMYTELKIIISLCVKGLVDITITSERRHLQEIILLLGDVKKNWAKRIFFRRVSYIGKQNLSLISGKSLTL